MWKPLLVFVNYKFIILMKKYEVEITEEAEAFLA